MINEQGEEVYVHCTTGVSRAPTLIIVYLAVYCRHRKWNDLPALKNFVTDNHPNAFPNMVAVELCIEKCK
jgi:protein-tyrosine phosphatase